MAHPTRIFHNELELSKAWEEYKEDLKVQAKGWPRIQYVGKDGMRVEDYPVLPFVLEGFYVYCRKHYGCVKEYFLNRDGYYDAFTTICSHIKEEIRSQQITGGMLGAYNPSITQRLNGLKEQVEQTNIEQPLFPEK